MAEGGSSDPPAHRDTQWHGEGNLLRAFLFSPRTQALDGRRSTMALSSGGRREQCVVDANYPFVLRERLGERGVTALDEVLAAQRTDLVTLMTDSFERRVAAEWGDLRAEMSALRSAIKTEMQELRRELRSDFKVEVANVRADLLKWSYIFWAGQVAIVASFVTILR